MIFLPLNPQHAREEFGCGVESVDRYLRESARQQMDKGLALTHVLVEHQESRQIVGFYTLLMSAVLCDLIPEKRLPWGRTAPVVLLAQFGVNQRFQGRGYGRDLLYHALLMAMRSAETVGCKAVVLHAANDKAPRFYVERGFTELQDDPYHLWLPMPAIRDMFRIS